jgi:hypothetical protein
LVTPILMVWLQRLKLHGRPINAGIHVINDRRM